MGVEEDSIGLAPLKKPQFLCGEEGLVREDSVWEGLGSYMRVARPRVWPLSELVSWQPLEPFWKWIHIPLAADSVA